MWMLWMVAGRRNGASIFPTSALKPCARASHQIQSRSPCETTSGASRASTISATNKIRINVSSRFFNDMRDAAWWALSKKNEEQNRNADRPHELRIRFSRPAEILDQSLSESVAADAIFRSDAGR